MKRVLILAGFLAVVAGCGEDGNKVDVPLKPHVAKIGEGAVPVSIGCDEGCDKINQFREWMPYLQKAADVHKHQMKCKEIFDVMPDISSDPANPSFRVACYDDKRRLYNTFYTKSELDSGSTASSEPVSMSAAYEKCGEHLERWSRREGYSVSKVARKYGVAANGSAVVQYDFHANDLPKKASCLVGRDVNEFNVVM